MKPPAFIQPMPLDPCRLVRLPRLSDPRGHLSFAEGGSQVPFAIQRVFYMYGIPEGGGRGGHALKRCHQLLIALAGGFDVVLDDGVGQRRERLEAPDVGLLIPPMIWRSMDRFAAGSICLVLASEKYSEEDYYRRRDDYVAALANSRTP